jgi:hemerythrin
MMTVRQLAMQLARQGKARQGKARQAALLPRHFNKETGFSSAAGYKFTHTHTTHNDA